MTMEQMNVDLVECVRMTMPLRFDDAVRVRALLACTQNEVCRLRRLNEELCERVAAQSELLTNRAEATA